MIKGKEINETEWMNKFNYYIVHLILTSKNVYNNLYYLYMFHFKAKKFDKIILEPSGGSSRVFQSVPASLSNSQFFGGGEGGGSETDHK